MRDKKYYKCEDCGKAIETDYNDKDVYGKIALCKKCKDNRDKAEIITQYDNCYGKM